MRRLSFLITMAVMIMKMRTWPEIMMAAMMMMMIHLEVLGGPEVLPMAFLIP